MAPWNTDEPDIDEMLTPAFYGETILDTPLLLYGMKYIPLKEFTPLPKQGFGMMAQNMQFQ